jgi:cell division protein FtsW (lipid II flippase)
MRATVAYTSARVLLFVVVVGVLYLVGARGWLLIPLGVLVSGVVSLLLLSRQRDAMSGIISARLGGFRERLDEGARREDDET